MAFCAASALGLPFIPVCVAPPFLGSLVFLFLDVVPRFDIAHPPVTSQGNSLWEISFLKLCMSENKYVLPFHFINDFVGYNIIGGK